MLLTSYGIHALERHIGLEREKGLVTQGPEQQIRFALHNKEVIWRSSEQVIPSAEETLNLYAYTLLLMARILIVAAAVFEAYRHQARKVCPNFWVVFLALVFPEIYLIVHLSMSLTASPLV